MNRILFEREEIVGDRAVFGGERAQHVLAVLHGEVGQTLKTGEIDGAIGTSTIEAIDRSGNVPKITVRINHHEESLRPWVDLILAPPRPRVLKRLLPQLTALGVGKIVLVGAWKVEKDFWGATLLKPENYRPLLVEGLMQSGTSILPELILRRGFGRFLDTELETLLPTSRRLVAHPGAMTAGSLNAQSADSPTDRSQDRLLLAIGPEGGWTDAELAHLEAHHFQRYSLGSRILRTDTAAIALLAQLSLH